MIFVEFVPVTEESKNLAPGEAERDFLAGEIARLREEWPEMVYISFPGDEKSSGGCVAAGRGFFHIAQDGSAEPCPFSPYSVANVAEVGLEGALRSPFFERVRKIEANHSFEHEGGCALFAHADEVRAAL